MREALTQIRMGLYDSADDTLEAALSARPAAGDGEAVDIEAVGIVRHDDDGEPYIEWLGGGDLHGFPESVVLSLVNGGADIPDGYMQAYTAPPAREGVPEGVDFQAGVERWMDQCFLPSLYSNMTERGDRLLEEVLELLQSGGYDRSRVATLVDYVWGRPAGEPGQEVGGVMVTLAGYCWIAGLNMHAEGARELERITQPEVMAKIRAKQEAKNALHFDTPLPGAAAPTAGEGAKDA